MKVGQFVKVSSGRIGIITAGESVVLRICYANGCLGHRDIWFGVMVDEEPLVETLCVEKDWEIIETPNGI